MCTVQSADCKWHDDMMTGWYNLITSLLHSDALPVVTGKVPLLTTKGGKLVGHHQLISHHNRLHCHHHFWPHSQFEMIVTIPLFKSWQQRIISNTIINFGQISNLKWSSLWDNPVSFSVVVYAWPCGLHRLLSPSIVQFCLVGMTMLMVVMMTVIVVIIMILILSIKMKSIMTYCCLLRLSSSAWWRWRLPCWWRYRYTDAGGDADVDAEDDGDDADDGGDYIDTGPGHRKESDHDKWIPAKQICLESNNWSGLRTFTRTNHRHLPHVGWGIEPWKSNYRWIGLNRSAHLMKEWMLPL